MHYKYHAKNVQAQQTAILALIMINLNPSTMHILIYVQLIFKTKTSYLENLKKVIRTIGVQLCQPRLPLTPVIFNIS